jgi:hypothetical protein
MRENIYVYIFDLLNKPARRNNAEVRSFNDLMSIFSYPA